MTTLSKRQLQNTEYVGSLDFETLNPKEDIPMDATITIVGKRRMGKSEMIRYLCYELRDRIADSYLFTLTNEAQMGFFNFIPEDHIIKGIDANKIEEIKRNQLDMIHKNEAKGLTDKSKMPYVILIFDDLINTMSGLRHVDILANIYANGRHYNILSIVSVQGYKSVPPLIRDNTDVSIAFKFKNADTCDDFVKENFTVDNADTGKRILSKICADEENPFQCICVLSHLRTNDIKKQIKRCTAEIIKKPFLIGQGTTKVKDDYVPKLYKEKKQSTKKTTPTYSFLEPE